MEFLFEIGELCSQDPMILSPLSEIINDWIFTRWNVLQTIRRAERLFKMYCPPLMHHFIAFMKDYTSIRSISVEGDTIFILVTTRKSGDEICAISSLRADSDSSLDLVLVYDTARLRALVMSEVLDSWKWKWLWELGSEWAAYVMELLQRELDESRQIQLLSTTHHVIDFRREENYTSQYRRRCLKALRLLAKTFGVLPNSFYVEEAVRVGRHAVSGGGFADIWRGRFNNGDVCLKVLRIFTSDGDVGKWVLKEFCEEALVWKQLDHPNVLPFIGVNREIFYPSYCFVSPWMQNGNIMSYLEEHPEQDRLPWISQVANGLQYLHGLDPPIIHGDIRGANILVTDDMRCCLADFGLAIVSESASASDTPSTTRGSVRWMAPEILNPELFHLIEPTARDMYAFGCTMVEVFSGKVPFSDIPYEVAVIVQVLLGRRPDIPIALAEISADIPELIHGCWDPAPSRRPSARELSCFLSFYISE
ncbi:hypothetical protein GYMLUDRAFT_44736 [Collybiopsis luxurians FD-317 M1]|uniref:Protein kinase domain-containing protein n=1 Tax=Collybiopsis luxurians FD-317 M1 TaxID=944289 RepID=A0A0D0B7D9_9AGAR|nr:hypothetical protein GYMLUDRAFT_44736 [Collybiopsis luxurians FD-317 M1]